MLDVSVLDGKLHRRHPLVGTAGANRRRVHPRFRSRSSQSGSFVRHHSLRQSTVYLLCVIHLPKGRERLSVHQALALRARPHSSHHLRHSSIRQREDIGHLRDSEMVRLPIPYFLPDFRLHQYFQQRNHDVDLRAGGRACNLRHLRSRVLALLPPGERCGLLGFGRAARNASSQR